MTTPRAPLTEEQQRLVVEFDRYVPGLVHRVPDDLRRFLGGFDVVASDMRLYVIEAARDFDPTMRGPNGPTPFNAFAHLSVARRLPKYLGHARRTRRLNRQFPERDDGERDAADVLPDCRSTVADPLLHLWCSAEYVERRQCLDLRTRVLLYLRAVECMTTEEAGAAMGMTADEARAGEQIAAANVAYLRNPLPFGSVPTDRETRKNIYKRHRRGGPVTLADGSRKCACCPAPAQKDRTRCKTCRDKKAAQMHAEYVARRAAGRCIVRGCTAASRPGLAYCHDCNETMLRANRARKSCKPGAATGSRYAGGSGYHG